jgi:hypothetical protein
MAPHLNRFIWSVFGFFWQVDPDFYPHQQVCSVINLPNQTGENKTEKQTLSH